MFVLPGISAVLDRLSPSRNGFGKFFNDREGLAICQGTPLRMLRLKCSDSCEDCHDMSVSLITSYRSFLSKKAGDLSLMVMARLISGGPAKDSCQNRAFYTSTL